MSLDNYTICLHQTSHPGNIGSVARAMKTMGLSDLRLIDCVDHHASDAYAMACGADDILFHAQNFTNLNEAFADCHRTYGLSARPRADKRAIIPTTQISRTLDSFSSTEKIAFLFGNEKHGLDNDSLALCHNQIIIPSNSDYHSLNLSQAVQIICYLISTHKQSSVNDNDQPLMNNNTPATEEKKTAVVDRLEQLLIGSKLINPQNPLSTLHKIRDILFRANLQDDEADLLCGIFKSLNKNQ